MDVLIPKKIGIILRNKTKLLQNGDRLLRNVRVIMIGDHVIGQQLDDFRICHFVIVKRVYLPQQVNYFILLANHLHPSH
jgi:hypothetical protein